MENFASTFFFPKKNIMLYILVYARGGGLGRSREQATASPLWSAVF